MTAPLSPSNPRIKRLARLVRDRSARRDEHTLVVDGPRALRTFADCGATLESVFTDDPERNDVEFIDPAVVHVVERHVLDRISDAASAQGVLALAQFEPCILDDLDDANVVVLLDAVQDPGNVGAVVRIAAATGAGVVVANGSADPYSPRAVRASAGNIAATRGVDGVSAADALRHFETAGFSRIGAAMAGGDDPRELDRSRPVVIVLGSEGAGLSDEVEAHLDGHVTLSMRAPVESLNVAVTAGIVLYQLRP